MAKCVRKLDRHDRVTVVPAQNKNRIQQLGLTTNEVLREAWAVTPDGERLGGAGAFNLVAEWLTGWPFTRFYRWPIVRQLQDVAYWLVAWLRPYLPGVTPYCKQHPEACSGETEKSDD